MTAAPIPASRSAVPSFAVRARDVLASEWTKLRSVRSNSWTALAAAVVTIGITAIVARGFAAAPKAPPAAISGLTASFLGYAEYTVLPWSILGALAFTSEYSTGHIRITFTAVPQRRVILAAKALVVAIASLVAGELLAFASYFLAQAILAGSHRDVPLSHPGVVGAVLAAGIVLPACTVVGLGLGAIIRHTAGAIAATVTAIYLLAVLCLVLPSPWREDIGRFTLAFAAYQVVSLHPQAHLFSPAVSICVLIAWPVVVLLVAAVLITRRDT